MASDLQERLRSLLEDLSAGSQPTIARLCLILDASEVEVRRALRELEPSVPAASRWIEQTVHGTAHTQVGSHNAQWNVHGPLVHVQASGEVLPSEDALRAMMAEPDVLHDTLEHHLVRQHSKRVLSSVLTVSAEQPEWELLFQEWVNHTPLLHGQTWFVKATVQRFTEELSDAAAARRHGFFNLLFKGLLDAGNEKAALELFKFFLSQLEQVAHWANSHWNLLNGVTTTFWLLSDLGEKRLYPSPERRDETQHMVDLYLRHMSDHLRHARNAHNTNEFLTALAYLLDSIPSDQIITLIDYCTQDNWLAEVLDRQTARELLNALDQSRLYSAWWESEDTQESRLFRHRYADFVATQILEYVEQQIGRTEYFYELVRRAGMQETDDRTLISRYVLEVMRMP